MISQANVADPSMSLSCGDAAAPLAGSIPGDARHHLFSDFISRLWGQLKTIRVQQKKKRLRVCETVPFGEKRFVAVIQVDNQQFLVGGSSNSISLLAQLEKAADFASVLSKESIAQG